MTVADFVHVDNWAHQVHVEPPAVEVWLAEQFHVWRQEFLRETEAELEFDFLYKNKSAVTTFEI